MTRGVRRAERPISSSAAPNTPRIGVDRAATRIERTIFCRGLNASQVEWRRRVGPAGEDEVALLLRYTASKRSTLGIGPTGEDGVASLLTGGSPAVPPLITYWTTSVIGNPQARQNLVVSVCCMAQRGQKSIIPPYLNPPDQNLATGYCA
jgi:hypothetical protein